MTKLTETEIEHMWERVVDPGGPYPTDSHKLLAHIETLAREHASEIAETREATIKECFDYLLYAAANNYGRDQEKRDVENDAIRSFAWKSIKSYQAKIAEKDARIKELEGALKPIAQAVGDWSDYVSDEANLIIGQALDGYNVFSSITVGNVRNAAKALRDGGEDG